jgi:hypothetical protein
MGTKLFFSVGTNADIEESYSYLFSAFKDILHFRVQATRKLSVVHWLSWTALCASTQRMEKDGGRESK